MTGRLQRQDAGRQAAAAASSSRSPTASGCVRGGFPIKTMNVYFVRDGDGVLMFDAGIKAMTNARRRGRRASSAGITRDRARPRPRRPPRRGAGARRAGLLPPGRQGRRRGRRRRALLRLSSASTRSARVLLPRLLPVWDGGPVQIAGTLAEGDDVAGFKVVHLPGHAPGLIGAVARVRPPGADQRLLLHARPADRAQGPAARPARRRSTRTPSRRGRRSASSRRWSRASAWPGHADPLTRRREGPAAEGRGDRPSGGRWWAGGRAGGADGAAAGAGGRVRRPRTASSARAARRADAAHAARRTPSVLAGSPLTQEDAWQRAVEFLFERLAVRWTISGVATEGQKELLLRLRAATPRGAALGPRRAARALRGVVPRRGGAVSRRRAGAELARPRPMSHALPADDAAAVAEFLDPAPFADLLAGYCLDVQPGQQVVVRSTTLAAPLLLELQRAILERDAWPTFRVELPGESAGFYAHARRPPARRLRRPRDGAGQEARRRARDPGPGRPARAGRRRPGADRARRPRAPPGARGDAEEALVLDAVADGRRRGAGRHAARGVRAFVRTRDCSSTSPTRSRPGAGCAPSRPR